MKNDEYVPQAISVECESNQDVPRPRLLDQVRDAIRLKHYSIRTEQTYIDWIRRYILFHNKQHPQRLEEQHINEFLTHLAVERSLYNPRNKHFLLSFI